MSTGNPEIRCLSGEALDSTDHLTTDLLLQPEYANIVDAPIEDGALLRCTVGWARGIRRMGGEKA